MILLINICKEKLHYLEFVKPVEDILKASKITFSTKFYKEIIPKDLEKADKVIICGTSLKDNEFMENIDKFGWIKTFDKPILGICGGMQIIGRVFGGKKGHKTEIGFFKEFFDNDFLGMSAGQIAEVYHLHNYHIYFSSMKDFNVYSISDEDVSQAVKHKTKEIYGTLFHPEVRQKKLISNFCSL